MSTGPTRVTLLTQDACSLCHHAKDVLARVGHDLPLEVEEIDRTSLQGRELATRSGVLFARRASCSTAVPSPLVGFRNESCASTCGRRPRGELDAGPSHTARPRS
ncbi:MAG: glutaredoxin family protein [Actinomycetota bacterium]|nr:glutaredoxin family protein [Actinomycetota bacterium]